MTRDRHERTHRGNIRTPSRGSAKDIHSCAPRLIDQVIGQRRAVQQVKVALEASWNDGTRFPHTLLVGPLGVGKSLMAEIISAEMHGPDQLRKAHADTLMWPGAIQTFVLEAADRDVLSIEKVSKIARSAQDILVQVLDDGMVLGPGPDKGWSAMLPIADFTLLAATNHEEALSSSLRDRFEMTLRLGYYGVDELAELLHRRCRVLGWNVEAQVFEAVAAISKGVPRTALRLLETCRRTARSENAGGVDMSHWERTVQLEDIDAAFGLDPVERRYLAILGDAEKPVSLQLIARGLGLSSATVTGAVEEYLIREGFVGIAPDVTCRKLTPKGIEYLCSRTGWGGA